MSPRHERVTEVDGPRCESKEAFFKVTSQNMLTPTVRRPRGRTSELLRSTIVVFFRIVELNDVQHVPPVIPQRYY